MKAHFGPAWASAAASPQLDKNKTEWKQLLPPTANNVLFEHGPERAGSSSLNAEKRPGTYVRAACILPLFNAVHRYERGTG